MALKFSGGSLRIQAMLGGSTTCEAIYLCQPRPELTVPVVAKYMRVAKDDPAVVEAQRTVGQLLNQNLPLVPRRCALRVRPLRRAPAQFTQ